MSTSLSCLRVAAFSFIAIFTGACSQNSGQQSPDNRPAASEDEGGPQFVYNGPPPATPDIQNFKVSVWDNLVLENRCGACHIEGEQAPFFVDNLDVNDAYAETNQGDLVRLDAPALSRLVTKVAEGHNCWTDQPQVCADVITNYIEAWAASSGAKGNVIVLTAPAEKTVSDSRSFPAESDRFAEIIHTPYLSQHCSRCHSEDASDAQQPYFAGKDVDAAYVAARSKINLDVPENSRFYQRLASESHYCWSTCSADASAMLQAIRTFRDGIDPTEINPQLIVSNAITFSDGVVVSAGGRIESNVIALYEFKTDDPDVAYDTSGIDPPLNLMMTGDVSKLSTWGIRLNGGKAQGPTSSSAKLNKLIKATGEYSIEAWVVPANVTQEGPARIVSYSGGNDIRNFTLGQTLYNYDFMNRSSVTDANGMITLSTPTANEVLQATLQHVVLSFEPVEGRKIYVNGSEVVTEDPAGGGNLNDWDDSFALVLGQETSGEYGWLGSVRMLAIHNRALTAEHAKTNYDVGVGEKRFMLFGISHLVNMPDAYIGVVAQAFDEYSYLFDAPFFISLDQDAVPVSPISIEGIRIGMNGREVSIGQAYANVSETISADNYSPEGVTLSNLGTLVPIDKGADLDEFFLTFDQISGVSFNRPAEQLAEVPAPSDVEVTAPVIGLRNFAEINHTLSAMTGVAMNDPDVVATFEAVKQQLPTAENVDGFLAAHQMGITQLAVKYCNKLVSDSSMRAEFFSGFNFSANASTAFDTVGRAQIVDPLLQVLVANDVNVGSGETANLQSQPLPDDTRLELNRLIDAMTACGGSCPAGATANTVTAVCAAALGSALMLIQ